MKDKGCFTIGCATYLLLTLIIGVYGCFFYEDDKKETVKTEQVKKDTRQAKANVTFKPAVIKTDVVKSEFLGDIEVQHVVLPRNYTINSQFGPTVKAGEKVKALFYVAEDYYGHSYSLYPVVENAHGERYTLYVKNSADFDKLLAKPLKVLNPNFHHYVGGTLRQTHDFVYGMHISDVVKKWGEYTHMQKLKDGTYQYGFSHITRVHGISRSHTFYCNTDADGYVVTTQYGHESSNLFGYLFFYADILSMNIFSSYEPVMYDNRDEFFKLKRENNKWGLYIMYSLAASFFSFLLLLVLLRIRILNNNVVMGIFNTVFVILQYILLISFLECSSSWWLLKLMFLPSILLPVPIFIKMFSGIKYRCPKCHKMAAVSYETKPTSSDEKIIANITFAYPSSGSVPTYKTMFVRSKEKVTVASCKSCSYVNHTYTDDKQLITTCPKCGKHLFECAMGKNGEVGTVNFYNLEHYFSGNKAILDFDFIYEAQCKNCGWDYKYSGHFDVEKVVASQTPRRRASSSSDAETNKKSGSLGSCKHLRKHSDGSLRGCFYCNISSNNVSVSSGDDSCKCMRGGSNCSDYER